MNKRGQFFLIAALIIAGIIITLTTINISTKTPETKTTALYDLSREIDYESSSLIDYGIFQTEGVGMLLENLIANYSAANPDTELVFIYGSSDDETLTGVSHYIEKTGIITLDSAGYPHSVKKFKPVNSPVKYNKVSVNLTDNSTIFFDLNSGQNFFIVLKREVEGETIVAQK